MRKRLYIKLKELREKNNLSQTKVAESLGVSRQAISQWETGVCQS
ncbi:MAG: helix-turn-helix transcriptional regulator [Tyzzerella sp.]|nr:helix-turn-helix transcriptional regulator [Tyzzerella sp.]